MVHSSSICCFAAPAGDLGLGLVAGLGPSVRVGQDSAQSMGVRNGIPVGWTRTSIRPRAPHISLRKEGTLMLEKK